MTKRLLLTILFAITASSAWAADVGCGRDTDQNGSVDNWCVGAFNCTDEDGDGYCTNGLGPNAGVDCNDHDFFDHPGGFYGTNSGCTSNQSKVCQTDGTYAACANFCPSTALHCYYIDPVSGNNSNPGTFASPWQTAAQFSDATTPPGTAHTRVPGDWYVYLGSPTFGDTVSKDGRSVGMNFGTSNGGTLANPIGVAGAPGYWPTFDSTGSASFVAIHDGGSYYKIVGFKVINSTCNGYTNSVCVANDDGTGTEFANLIFKDNIGTDNTAGLMLSNAISSSAHHFFVINHGQNGGNTDNTALFLGYRGTGNVVKDFVLYQTTDPGGGETIKVKHANYASDWDVERFITYNGQLQFASRQTTLKNGLVLDGKLTFNNPGGTSYTGDELIQYVTVINADNPFLTLAGYKDYNIDGSGTADHCASTFTISNIVFRDSIAQDSRVTGYSTNNRFGAFGQVDSDGMYNETRSAISLLSSVFYNPNQTVSFGLFEKNAGDTACGTSGVEHSGVLGGAYSLSGISSLLGSVTTSDYVESPSFSTIKVGTCTDCTGKGWNTNWGTASGAGSSYAQGTSRIAFGRRMGK